MARKAIFATGEFYHLYNRGTDKRIIFKNKADHERFIALLYVSNGTNPVHMENLRRNEQGRTLLSKALAVDRGIPLVDICAYVLMSNHFHLLVREHTEGGVSHFMQKLTTAYTMYFNKRHSRSGSLFQGKFKAQHADEDRYLKYLLSYIHLNPIKIIEPAWKETGLRNKKEAKKFLKTYSLSSYLDYLGYERPENKILAMEILPAYFEKPADFESSVAEWIDFNPSA